MTLDDAGPVIESIDILRVAIPYDSGRRRPATAGDTTLNAAAASVERMECLLVKVVDSVGRTGWGEAFGHAVNPVTFAALRDLVGPLYLGTPARPGAAPQADHALHAFGRSGPVLFAQSGIDIALWDLAAQRAGLPLRRLLNPHAADQVESYASLMVYDNEPEEVARRTKYAAEQGFWGVKLHETEYEAVAAARAVLPDGVELMVDVNCPWTPDEAERRTERLRDLDLTWLEEPVFPPDDAAALARLRATGVPVATGENASGPAGFAALFALRACDVAQPSVSKIGGISGLLEVGLLARTHGVRVVPHNFAFGPATLATAQYLAAYQPATRLEVPLVAWPMRLHEAQAWEPVTRLSDDPGLGFVPDQGVLDGHLIDSARLA
ncbi:MULTISPECIES: mandelate racemase/muconate lactonizing enzyme family protein [unclassified Streptomyces]|uniref:mandelate racemase/muconate lactonizing enzyme family protein n=1 Tax=unclassified Streptomyces TaxID=2593676 RepID=UPI002E19BB71